MTAPGIGQYGGYKYESAPSRALRTVSTEEYSRVYRDQGQLMSKMIGDITYMASYMRKMQKGIDQANENFVQQIQDFINDLIVLIGGGGDTGFDFGDFKYVLQGIGALFGFADENGDIKVPVDLFAAAWHFFSTYLVPTTNFTEVINTVIDSAIASILDVFGEVPILGQALQQLAVIISGIRDLVLPFADSLDDIMEFLGGAPFGDPSFDLWPAIENFLQSMVYPTGKVFTEWDLFHLGGGLGFPIVFPGVFGAGAFGVPPGTPGGLPFPVEFPGSFGVSPMSTLTPLQRWIRNVIDFLFHDFASDTFNLFTALEDFVNNRLIPTGLLAALSDIQEVIESIAGFVGAQLTDIVNRLQHLNIGSGGFDAQWLLNIANIPLLSDISVPGLGNLKDAIWQALTALTNTGVTLTELIDALKHIPGINVLGVGGPADIIAALSTTWDQLVGGFVGLVGVGAGLSDLFNVAFDVSSRASRGDMAFTISGIRNNKDFFKGFLPSSEPNVPYGLVTLGSGGPFTFPITQSTAACSWQRIEQACDKAAVQFEGFTVGSVTDAYVTIWLMDGLTGQLTRLHESANIIGLLSPTRLKVTYSLPTAVHVEPGDRIGRELAIRGTGSFQIIGTQHSSTNDPAVFPQNYASVRNSGTSPAPATIAHSPSMYVSNVPWFDFAVSAGDPGIPHSPLSEFYGSLGTVNRVIPPWANTVQVVIAPAGGGGRQGATLGFAGQGGRVGTWATAVWTRGPDFTGTPTLVITNAAGGLAGVTALPAEGGPGGTATVSMPGRTLTAIGGLGGTTLELNAENIFGQSLGTIVLDSIPYVGGGFQRVSGSSGALYGGGGAGGSGVAFQEGGPGARSGIWLRFKG